MSKKLTKEEAFYFVKTWRDSLEDEPRVEDGYHHDVADDLHIYFEATGERDWMGVADEATKIYNIMFMDEHEKPINVDNESPMASVWRAASAQAAHGVWQAVADAFGLNVDVLEDVLEDWYLLWDGNKTPPPPITMGEFMKRYKAEYKWWTKSGLLKEAE